MGFSPHYRVRVAHGRRDELNPLAVEREDLRFADVHGPHLHLDLEAPAHPRDDFTGPDRDPDGLGTASPRQPAGCDPSAVPRELGRRAVGVPDHDLSPVLVGGHDLEHAVGTDAEVVVAQAAYLFRRQRRVQVGALDQQVIVAQPVPFRESHPPPHPEGDRRAG